MEVEGARSLALEGARAIVSADNGAIEVRALDTGQRLWSEPASAAGGIAAHGDRLVHTAGPALHATRLENGQRLWSMPLAGPSAGPAINEDAVFVASGQHLQAYRLEEGTLVWSQTLDAAATLPPIVSADGTVIAAAGSQLAAFARDDGRPMWRTELDAPVAAMTSAAETLVIATADGYPCTLDLATGDRTWCFRTTPVPAAGRPLVVGGLAYFALLDNTVRAFNLEGGTLARLERLPMRPASGPLQAGSHLAVPLATGSFALVALEARVPPVVVPAAPPADERLLAAAATADGAWLVSLSIHLSGRYTLAAYGRPSPKPAPAPPSKSPQ